jgi:hypothetical protein
MIVGLVPSWLFNEGLSVLEVREKDNKLASHRGQATRQNLSILIKPGFSGSILQQIFRHGVNVMITVYCWQFSPIFSKKIGVFLKTQ